VGFEQVVNAAAVLKMQPQKLERTQSMINAVQALNIQLLHS